MGISKRISNSQYGLLRSNSASTLLKHNNISTRSFDGGSRSLDRDKLIPDASGKDNVPTNTCDQNLISETNGTHMESANGTPIGNTKPEHEDYVSGMLYNMLQKEVVSLRKACNERNQTLKDKDDAIETLAKKLDTLSKAMEVEAKKIQGEVAAIHVSKEHDQRMWRISTPRGERLRCSGSNAPSSHMRGGSHGALLPEHIRITPPRGAVNSSHLTSARQSSLPCVNLQ